MMLVQPLVTGGGAVPGRRIEPGDIVAGGESLKNGALSTAGSGTWTAAAIATGIINRTGPTAGFTDTTDTAQNILLALAGNAYAADVKPGSTFRMKFINTTTAAGTLAAGVGITLGTGSTLNPGSSAWRDYLFTVVNASNPVTVSGSLVSASATVAFAFPDASRTSFSIGPASAYNQLDPGMTVTSGSAGIQSGTTVSSVTQGQGGITGIVMSATATATAVVALSLGPTLQIDSLGAGTL